MIDAHRSRRIRISKMTEEERERLDRLTVQVMGLNLLLTALCHDLHDDRRSQVVSRFDALREILTADLLAANTPDEFLDHAKRYFDSARQTLTQKAQS